MLKKSAKALSVLILLGIFVGVRSYKINAPLADWHSSRQADTAAVARNFVQERFNLFYPQSDSLWALSEHQLPNPHRYFMNEFPLYNAVVAVLYQQFGIHESIGRMVSIFFAGVGALALFGIVDILIGTIPALAVLAYYSLLPYNIYYGRVFMPDPTFVGLSILSLYFCIKWVQSEKKSFGLALMTTFAAAMLVKPYAIFMAIPLSYWVLVNWGRKTFKQPFVYLIAIGSLIPLMLWRLHIARYPEGSFYATWLLNGDGIRFKGAFFRWLIFDRLNRLIFATGGFALFVTGLLTAHLKKNTSLFFVWTLSVLLYMTVFAKGNVNHDYYQLPIVAPGVVLAVLGAKHVLSQAKNKLSRLLNLTIVLGLFSLSVALGWFEVRDYFKINNPAIVEAGKAVDRLLPKEAIVIAPYFGDQAFLYQTNRRGWPVGGNIDEHIREGATHYVTTSRDQEYNELKATYPVVYENDLYSIIKLAR